MQTTTPLTSPISPAPASMRHPLSFTCTTLTALVAFVVLTACRQEVPPPPLPSPEPAKQVTPSTDLRGASDHPDAPPAIGAMTAGQDAGGARSKPMQATGGDRASGAASSASSVN